MTYSMYLSSGNLYQILFNLAFARLPICEEGPQHAESENVAAQEGIKVVSDPEIVEARRGQRIKYPNTRLTGYKTK